MKGSLFITGTDTGIGKTFVTVEIGKALQRKGLNVGVMKPVETGCKNVDGKLVPGDASFLKQALELKTPLDVINPYRFAPPLAPSVAAREAGVTIDLNTLWKNLETLSEGMDVVLVEGAGGLLVPISDDKTIADLIESFAMPAIIVAASRLGCINHTLLTIRHAKSLGVNVKGVILNHTQESDSSVKYNCKELRSFGAKVLAEIPYLTNKDRDNFRLEDVMDMNTLF